MKKYRYKVALVVEVEAFNEDDGWEVIVDNFGVGEQNGLTITECEWEFTKSNAK